jgi:hypothetical protein
MQGAVVTERTRSRSPRMKTVGDDGVIVQIYKPRE